MLAGHALAEVRDAIVAAVHHVHPEIGADDVLSAIDLGASAGSDDFWTIDPVDGTKGFLRAGQYAIALARIVRGEAVMAVLGCPNLAPDASRPFDDPTEEGTLLLAMRAPGAGMRRAGALGRGRACGAPIDPLGVVRLGTSVDASVSVLGTGFDGAAWVAAAATGAWSSVGSATGTATARGPRRVAPDASSPGTSPATAPTPGRTTAKRRRILAPFMGRMTVVQLDSQVKYAMLARGQGDIYLRPPRPAIPVEHIWDHAAGSLVASEAGATVTDLRGRALDFGRGRDLSDNCGVLACAPELHAAILRAAASVDLDPFAAG
ncbi:MAG: inositol monophosphatase family protein [Phycisphaerales bacterium]